METKKKVPMTDTTQSTGTKLLTFPLILSHNIDDMSTKSGMYEEEIIECMRAEGISVTLQDEIDKANTIEEVEKCCVDYVIGCFKAKDREYIAYEDFDGYIDEAYKLYSEAVSYHNESSTDVWNINDSLSRKSLNALRDNIPVIHEDNYSDVLLKMTNIRIKDFLDQNPDFIQVVSSDYSTMRVNESVVKLGKDILTSTAAVINNHNANSKPKWHIPTKLSNRQIADIILNTLPVKSVITRDKGDVTDECLMLHIYINDPADANLGIYSGSNDIFRSIIKDLNYDATLNDEREIIELLRRSAPRVRPESNADLIAVNNGIFNYKTKELRPFSQDYVFLTKCPTDYNPNAINKVIHNNDDGTDWDVESWMAELTDDPEITQTLWEIIGATIRPNTRWNKSAMLYSKSGNNGKGTFCELMRQLCGEGNYASIPLSDFGKEFALEPLTRVSAIIVDENDVGTYIDKAGNFKSIVTNDVISINRKYKDAVTCQFRGFMIQCLNEFPRFKDKTDSLYRRLLFIPMLKCFTGCERKYIKNDYLKDKDVLEYVLYKVLNMNYYELSIPQASVDLLDEYKAVNDPLIEFWNEVRESLTIDKVPFGLLYALYVVWSEINNPGGTKKSNKPFTIDMKSIIEKDSIWELPESDCQFKVTKDMTDWWEPLIDLYDPHHKNDCIKTWIKPIGCANYVLKFQSDKYRGIVKR